MADEPKEPSEDIQGILSDLDAILSGSGVPAEMSPRVAAPAEAAPPMAAEPVKPPEAKPVPAPKPVEPPKPAEPARAVELPKPVEPPKSTEPPKFVASPTPAASEQEMKIELAQRAGAIPPPSKSPESPKPPAPRPVPPLSPAAPKPIEPPQSVAPSPAAAAKPAAPAAAGAVEDIPAGTPKDQIRRIAYVYTFSCAEARAGLAAYLSQAARTISKKPIYLRQVLAAELSAASDPFAVFEKAREAKAVAVLAVVEGWPSAKIEGLSEACARGGLLFRTVAPADVQKKSTAVDVIVDMMLLSGEA